MNQPQTLLLEGLVTTKHVANAALIRISDSCVITATPGFSIQTWAQVFIQAFANNLISIRREGLYFKDRHYRCVRADDISIYLKAKAEGVILAKTRSLIVIATYCQGMYPSVCVEAVEKLAAYLREKGN